jgi:hypothetical protein
LTTGYFDSRTNNPEPHEVSILNEILVPYAKIAISAGRGGGKTLLLSIILIYMAVCHDKSGIIFSGTTAQADVEMRYIKELIDRNPMIKTRQKTFSGRGNTALVEFIHSTDPQKTVTIKVLPEDRLRGEHGSVIICDEACQVKKENIEIASGNVVGEWLFILASTPHRSDHYFTGILDNPKTLGYKTFYWSLEDLKHWKGIPEKIKDMRSVYSYSKSSASCEIDGKVILSDNPSTFDSEKIRKMRDDTLRPMGNPLFMSIDWNQGGKSPQASYTVAMLWENNGEQGLSRLGVWEFKKQEINEIIEEIAKIVDYPYDGSPGPVGEICADSNPPLANDLLRARLTMPRRGDKDPYQELFMRDCRVKGEGCLMERLRTDKIKIFVRGIKEEVLVQRKLQHQLLEYESDPKWLEGGNHFHDHADSCIIACYHARRSKEGTILNPIQRQRIQDGMKEVLKTLGSKSDENLDILKLLSKDNLTEDDKWTLWNSEQTLSKLGELRMTGQEYVKDPDNVLTKIDDAIIQIRSSMGKKKKLDGPI